MSAPNQPTATAQEPTARNAYVIRRIDRGTAINHIPTPGTIIPIYLQKYQFHPQRNKFLPVFPSGITFNLNVTDCFDRADGKRDLPYQLNGFAVEPVKLTQIQCRDRFAIGIQQQFRLTFRYNPWEGNGCLVHLGIDTDPVDDTLSTLLWKSAINQDITQAENAAK